VRLVDDAWTSEIRSREQVMPEPVGRYTAYWRYLTDGGYGNTMLSGQADYARELLVRPAGTTRASSVGTDRFRRRERRVISRGKCEPRVRLGRRLPARQERSAVHVRPGPSTRCSCPPAPRGGEARARRPGLRPSRIRSGRP
jgi:hypothetical protein